MVIKQTIVFVTIFNFKGGKINGNKYRNAKKQVVRYENSCIRRVTYDWENNNY